MSRRSSDSSWEQDLSVLLVLLLLVAGVFLLSLRGVLCLINRSLSSSELEVRRTSGILFVCKFCSLPQVVLRVLLVDIVRDVEGRGLYCSSGVIEGDRDLLDVVFLLFEGVSSSLLRADLHFLLEPSSSLSRRSLVRTSVCLT